MSILTTNNNIFKNIFFLVFLTELLSFLGYYYHLVNSLVFLVIIIITIFAALYKIEYGLYILLTELFIGSFGYIFFLDLNETQISLRLALWLVIMSIWLAKVTIGYLKTKEISFNFSGTGRLAPLAIFAAWGLLNGLINGNSLNNIFFDFNNWLFFLLIFPVSSIIKNAESLKFIKSIFLASIAWLSAKTVFLAYVFTHNFNGLNLEIYGWMRADRLGEITETSAGFSRIFMQSQIFILIGFFILLFCVLKTVIGADKIKLGDLTKYIGLLVLFLSSIIISFSRSFWLGLLAGGISLWLIALIKLRIKFRRFLIYNCAILFVVILSLILTMAAVKFPYPSAYSGFSPADLISRGATQITKEAGASSRWRLLPPLWQKIKTAPFFGRGFGATVTYKTLDPRALSANPDGLYTTYSFEWGWLDVWLKLGLFGLLAYILLFIGLIRDGLKINSYFSLFLSVGLAILMAVNITSPYVNHPLGIGYIILAMAMMENMKNPLALI